MKKFIIFGAIAFALVIIAAYFFRIDAPQQPDAVAGTSYYPIVIYIESGEIKYKAPSDNNFIVSSSSSVKVPNMTIVETLPGGKATALLPDNSTISLEENTQLTINYTDTKTSIFQAFGTTYHRVEKLITGGSYQVQTPETLAAVRGTKFGVRYDKQTKVTKVSVTESTVEVSKTLTGMQATSTKEDRESKVLKVGETVVIEGLEPKDLKEKKGMLIIRTEFDQEMSGIINKEKRRDELLEEIKKDVSDKEKIREKIREEFFNDKVAESDQKDQEESSKEVTEREKAVSIKPAEDTPKENPDQLKKNVKTETAKEEVAVKKEEVPTRKEEIKVITKLSEEAFFTQFEGMFIKYFYVDEENTPCSVNLSAAEKVKRVTSFAEESGYPITRNTLASFAEAIADYCQKKDPSIKESLQKRFDIDYPFQ